MPLICYISAFFDCPSKNVDGKTAWGTLTYITYWCDQ